MNKKHILGAMFVGFFFPLIIFDKDLRKLGKELFIEPFRTIKEEDKK